jgi:hypothetical protein
MEFANSTQEKIHGQILEILADKFGITEFNLSNPLHNTLYRALLTAYENAMVIAKDALTLPV